MPADTHVDDKQGEGKVDVEVAATSGTSGLAPASGLQASGSPVGEAPYNFDPRTTLKDHKAGQTDNPDHSWQKVLFEIYLSRKDVNFHVTGENGEQWMTESYFNDLPEHPSWGDVAKNGYAKAQSQMLNLRKTLDDYEKLGKDVQDALAEDFMKLQSPASVDLLSRLDDDNKGSCDCFEINKAQGYWNARALYDPAWGYPSYSTKNSAWLKREGLLQKWLATFILIPWVYPLFLSVIGILTMGWEAVDFEGYPWVVFIIHGLVIAFLLYIYVKWIFHFVCNGGWRTFWKDVTVERTYPGAVRYFSIDYWCMMWIFYLWLFFDTSHWDHWQLLVTHAVLAVFPAGPQVLFVSQCTLSSSEQNIPLAVAYFISGIVWLALWLPLQQNFMNGGIPDQNADKFKQLGLGFGADGKNTFGPTYAGRMTLGLHNKNISFITYSVMITGLSMWFMYFCWIWMNIDWWVLPVGFWAGYFTVKHIGLAALFMMGFAKIIAADGFVNFDHYNMCTWTFWGQVDTL